MGNSTKELVNAFNLNNYGVGNVNTNFTVEGKKIFGLFANGTNIEEYLQGIGEEIIKQHYGTKEVAGRFYNLNYFPFVLGANPDKEYLSNGMVKVKLADSTNNEVIRNLKVHFANEFKRAVKSKVVARLQKAGITKEGASEWVIGTVKTGAIGSPYLYCIAFSDEYLKRKYDSETFEVLKGMYIQEFNSRLRECVLKSSDFYDYYGDDMLYIKDVSDKVVKSVAEYVKKEVAFDFRTPGTEDSKVENFKDVLGDFIFKWTGKSINAYEYDVFTDKKEIENGNDFVLIPLTKRYSGQLESLKHKDAYKVNTIHKDFLSDIRGMTAKPDVASYENPVYVISNKGIAQLLPKIMESPIAYNERNGCFEFAVDLTNFKRRGSSRSSSTVTSPLNSPTHAGPSGLRTPPSQRNRDSGYDSNSPPKPKDSVAPSTSGGPRSSVEQSQVQGFPTRSQDEALNDSPRRGSEKLLLHTPVNLAGTSIGFWPSTQLSFPTVSQGVSGPSKSGGNLGAAAASGSIPGSSLWSQSGASSWKGAGKNMLTGSSPWSVPPSTSSLTTRNDSISSNLGIFADPPEDTENICSMKEKQQVTKEKEEEKLSKALLYTLNLMNYTLDGVYTNFFAKDGKIVSLLHDNVDREKYLQAVRDYIIKEYCEDEEEARELYDFDEFPFKLNCEEKQGKTVVANISSGALSNLKILFSQMLKKDVDAIDISAVKKVEEREKDEWVDRQRSYGASLQDACESCFPDEGPMKIIPIAFEGGEYVLDRSRDTCEVNLLFKEQLRRFRGTSLEKRKSSDKPLTEEEKNLFKELLYAFNLNNQIFECHHTNFIVENGKIASLVDDSVNVEEYLQEVIDKTKEEYRVNEKEAYDLNEFPFKFLSNCEKNQETTVVANINCGALFNLKKLFIQEHEKKVEIEDIDINIVKKAVKSKKDEWVDSRVKERRARPREAITTCYPDESKLEHIPIIKGKDKYYLDRTFETWEVESFMEERWPAKGTSKAEKMKSEDNKDSGVSSENATSDYLTQSEPEPMDHEGSPPVQQQNPLSDDEGNSSESSRSGSSNSSSGSDEKNTRKRLQERKSPSPEDGSSPRKSPKRGSLPLSRLESLSLSSSSHQIGKC